ncbi:hypothetical protein [Conexivisphaera calida]|uniref:hypothetical protein n=1 Tax=Conexivisphaera calida TaxID=1874277 RepID=UPI00157AAB74|nr:hypothetical protein [Conexivisphaera calida]
MSTMGLKFRAHADDATARALRARLDAACAPWPALRMGPPVASVELRPLPPARWQGGAMSREAPRPQPRSSSLTLPTLE